MQDIWDTAKRIRVSINKAKGQKRRLETTSLFKAPSIFSVQTISHLNIYITFSNASNQVSYTLLSSFVWQTMLKESTMFSHKFQTNRSTCNRKISQFNYLPNIHDMKSRYVFNLTHRDLRKLVNPSSQYLNGAKSSTQMSLKSCVLSLGTYHVRQTARRVRYSWLYIHTTNWLEELIHVQYY
jgi:hypothetical protein